MPIYSGVPGETERSGYAANVDVRCGGHPRLRICPTKDPNARDNRGPWPEASAGLKSYAHKQPSHNVCWPE
jgi:hypothetical protein